MESVPGLQSIASSDDFQTISSSEADPVDHLEVSRRARGKAASYLLSRHNFKGIQSFHPIP